MRRAAALLLTVILGALASACALKPTAMTVEVVQADAHDRVRPGATVDLKIEVRDEDGVVHKAGAPMLPAKDLVVTAKNADFDPAKMQLTLSPDFDRVGLGGTYEVTVALREHPAFAVTKTYKADWAVIRGPEPGDVASFSAEIEGVRQGETLIPGRAYNLLVKLTDGTGREFTNAGGMRTIPGARLEFTVANMAVEQNGRIVRPFREKARVSGNEFAVEVGYKGRATGTQKLAYPVDFATVEGPEPRDVASIQIIGGLSGQARFAPGENSRLDVMVTDTKGRRFATAQAQGVYELPRARLAVRRADNLAIDQGTGAVRFNDDYRSLVGKTFGIEIAYVGRQDAAAVFQAPPDFVKALPFMTANDLGAQGEAGRGGNDGSAGASSGSGRGGSGRDGARGGTGTRGPNIRVMAQEVRAMDGQTRLALIEVRVTGQEPKYYLRRQGGQPLKVVSVGGRGGKGGGGGQGGNGGDGGFTTGSNPRSGGDGGDGGSGGEGGRGGDGGAIEALISTPDLERVFVLDSQGGPGGDGGSPGFGGRGGSGGTGMQRIQMGTTSFNMPVFGSAGGPGSMGSNGPRGDVGNPGQTGIKVDEGANDIARRAPRDLTRFLLF
ncbi:MAG: hypothetical protein FJX47_10210 [Alphaproteobacteria bacterium]|nr:hypothetical protein [Alphaproteobacteria bacterium]